MSIESWVSAVRVLLRHARCTERLVREGQSGFLHVRATRDKANEGKPKSLHSQLRQLEPLPFPLVSVTSQRSTDEMFAHHTCSAHTLISRCCTRDSTGPS